MTDELTDLQQKNLELTRHNMELRDRVAELERERDELAEVLQRTLGIIDCLRDYVCCARGQ